MILHMVSSWLPPSVVSQVEAVSGVEATTRIMYVTGMIETGRERNLTYIMGLPLTHLWVGPDLGTSTYVEKVPSTYNTW